MRPVVIFSQHVLSSDRRAGFHWIAHGYSRLNWDVTFVTCGISRLSTLAGWLRPDPRLRHVTAANRNRMREVGPGAREYVHLPTVHPAHLAAGADWAIDWLASGYGRVVPRGVAAAVETADHLLFESAAALLFVRATQALNSRARMIYRVSDDLATLRAHGTVAAAERRVLPLFDLVSVPSPLMAARLSAGGARRVEWLPHGIDTASFAAPLGSPYPPASGRHVVSVGTMLFDVDSLRAAASALPELTFHVFGGLAAGGLPGNVRLYGERPFAELVPYIRHADVAAAFYRESQGMAYLRHTSNKLLQYQHARRPVVLPEALRDEVPYLFGYRWRDPPSIRAAFLAALAVDPGRLEFPKVLDWQEVVADLIRSVGSTVDAHAPPDQPK